MAYIKTLWEARQGVNLNRFKKSQETESFVVLTNEPDSITGQGTPFSPGNMNHIEEGVKAAHDQITAEETARKQADQALQTSINSQIAAERTARQQGDQRLQEQIDQLESTDPENILSIIDKESAARQQADQALQSSIDVRTQEIRALQEEVTISMIIHGLYTLHVKPNGDLVLRAPTIGNYLGLRVKPNGDMVAEMTDGRPNYFKFNADTGDLVFSIQTSWEDKQCRNL